MKKILFLGVLIIIGILLKIPPYVELNDLAIIIGIGIEENNDSCYVYLKEAIPIKEENGLKEKYKYYHNKGTNCEEALKKIKKTTKKKVYLQKSKYLIINHEKKLPKKFLFKNEKIYKTKKDVFKLLKEKS